MGELFRPPRNGARPAAANSMAPGGQSFQKTASAVSTRVVGLAERLPRAQPQSRNVPYAGLFGFLLALVGLLPGTVRLLLGLWPHAGHLAGFLHLLADALEELAETLFGLLDAVFNTIAGQRGPGSEAARCGDEARDPHRPQALLSTQVFHLKKMHDQPPFNPPSSGFSPASRRPGRRADRLHRSACLSAQRWSAPGGRCVRYWGRRWRAHAPRRTGSGAITPHWRIFRRAPCPSRPRPGRRTA